MGSVQQIDQVRRDPRCRSCRGRLIGSEVPNGICGDCSTSILRGVAR